MSSSEQAPEPTMDEILASIRKIISDDEPDEAPQPEAVAAEEKAGQDGLADELANALSNTQAEAEAGDDILDLTNVVAGQPQGEAPPGDVFQTALGNAVPSQDTAGATSQEAGDSDIPAVLAEAGIEPTLSEAPSESQPAAALSGDDLSAALEGGDAPQSASDSAETASISEALAAIAPPGTAEEAAASDDAEMAETAAAPPAADPAPEAPAPDPAPEAPAADPAPEAPAPEAAAPVEEATPVESAVQTTNGGESRTLEESVKDMLRPMLSKWLDDNLERIVQQEVAAGTLKGGGS